MFNLAFFDGETPNNSWIMWVVFGVIIVGMIVYMVFSQRKAKKQQSQMMDNLKIGATVTTIGGIVGTLVQLDDKHIWIETGSADNKTVMQFVRQAIHSVASSSAPAASDAPAESTEEEVDEIK